jgi:putative ABC transport system permease protein
LVSVRPDPGAELLLESAGVALAAAAAGLALATVGADARLDVAPAAAATTPALARRIAAAPGVRQAVGAQVSDRVRVVADSLIVAPRLVIVDASAFQRLLCSTPLPDAPALTQLAPARDRLTPAGHGDVPALVLSSDSGLRPGMRLELLRDGAAAIRLTAVGTAPAVGDAGDVVLVDAAAVAAAGMPVVPNTV